MILWVVLSRIMYVYLSNIRKDCFYSCVDFKSRELSVFKLNPVMHVIIVVNFLSNKDLILKHLCFGSPGSIPGVPPSPALKPPRPGCPVARPHWVLHLPLHQPPERPVPAHRGLLLHLGPEANVHRVLVPLCWWWHPPQQAPDLGFLGSGAALQLHWWPDGVTGLLRCLWLRPHTPILLHCLHDHPAGPPLCARRAPLQQQVWQGLETLHRCCASPANSWGVLERRRGRGVAGGREGGRERSRVGEDWDRYRNSEIDKINKPVCF